MKITVETKIAAPVEKIWAVWTTPEDIQQWNTASADWHTTNANVDLRVGGVFCSRMEAKDGSFGFDFTGTYTRVEPNHLLEYKLGDGRTVTVELIETKTAVTVRETFDSEPTHSVDQQREGWQAILDNFARYVTAKVGLPMSSDEQQIRELHSTWIDAVNAGDLSRLLTLMIDDVVFLNPGQTPLGRAKFSKNFSDAHQRMQINCISELEEVMVAGEFAYAWSRDTLSAAPRAGGEMQRLSGHRLTVYRKQINGRWLLARDAHTLSSADK